MQQIVKTVFFPLHSSALLQDFPSIPFHLLKYFPDCSLPVDDPSAVQYILTNNKKHPQSHYNSFNTTFLI